MEVIIGKWMKEQQETLKKEEEERKNLIVQKSVKKQPCALVLGINASCLWITNSSWNHMERPFFTGCHCVDSNKCLSAHTSEFVSTSYSWSDLLIHSILSGSLHRSLGALAELLWSRLQTFCALRKSYVSFLLINL